MRHYSFYLFTALIALALWSCGSSDEGVGDGSGTGGGHHNGTISGVAKKVSSSKDRLLPFMLWIKV